MCVVTIDETIVEWGHSRAPTPKGFPVQISAGQVQKEPVIDFLDKGKTLIIIIRFFCMLLLR